jgi:hypothetical protein
MGAPASETVSARLSRASWGAAANDVGVVRAVVLSEGEALSLTESLRAASANGEPVFWCRVKQRVFDRWGYPVEPPRWTFGDGNSLMEAIASWGLEPFDWGPLPDCPGFVAPDDFGCAYCGDTGARESPCRYCVEDMEGGDDGNGLC